MTLALPGFADPVAQSQSGFRAVLDAMARPGTLHEAGAGLTPPPPLGLAAAAVLLTLVDQDTPLWWPEGPDAAWEWIGFHCGAPRAAAPDEAAFVLADALPDPATLPAGTHEAPQDSATLILQVPALGTGPRLRLAGPGLREPRLFQAEGLPGDFVPRWTANHALFPRGVDLILCAGTRLAALPRSVTVEEG